MIKKTDQGDKTREKPEKPRELYVKPRLINYGHVEKLTQSGGTGAIDGLLQTKRK
jgi:hypothetical protein